MRMKFFNKSQAALEFIMTYGWAILVVLVAIGALAYFGVLSPDRFLPSRCTLQAGIGCLDHVASGTDGAILVTLQNSLGVDITSVTVKISGCTTSDTQSRLNNGGKLEFTPSGCSITSGKSGAPEMPPGFSIFKFLFKSGEPFGNNFFQSIFSGKLPKSTVFEVAIA